jgi:hypothetical protein
VILTGDRQQELPAKAQVDTAHQRAAFVSMVVMLSITMYAVAGLIIISTRGAGQGTPDPPVAFYAAALFLALGSIAFRRTQLRWMRLQAVAGVGGRAALIKHLLTVTIVAMAMAEIIGLLGLVLSFLGGDQREVLIFSAVALIVALSTYPRLKAWKSTVDYLTSGETDQALRNES